MSVAALWLGWVFRQGPGGGVAWALAQDNSNIYHEAQRLADERDGTPGARYLVRVICSTAGSGGHRPSPQYS